MTVEGALFFLEYLGKNQPKQSSDVYDESKCKELELLLKGLQQIQKKVRIIPFSNRPKAITDLGRGNYFLEIGYHEGVKIVKPTGRTMSIVQREKEHQKKYPEAKMTIAFSNQYDRTFESLVLDLLENDGAHAVRISDSELGEIFQVQDQFTLDYYYKTHEKANEMFNRMFGQLEHNTIDCPIARALSIINDLSESITEEEKHNLKKLALNQDARIVAAIRCYDTDSNELENKDMEIKDTFRVLSKL